jgi:hypothetical protein
MRTGPGLGDVRDMAMARRVTRPPTPLRFGAAGRRGLQVDREMSFGVRSARARSAHKSGAEVSPYPMDRMFGTAVGMGAMRDIGNESRTLAALQRFSVEVMAEALRLTDQVRGDERLLVMPGEGERPPVLMVMSPRVENAEESRVVSEDLDLPLAVLAQGLAAATPDGESPESAVSRHLSRGGPEALAELFLISQPEVVLTRRPRMVRLCVASPHVTVEAGGMLSTAGVLCRDGDGEFGVTACFHGTGPAGTAVTVAGRSRRVKRSSEVQDTVFIPIGDDPPLVPVSGLAGVRQDREPARADTARFDGAINQNQRTRIFSADAGLLRARPTVMLKLQTDPDTDRGDSGCALLDDEDRVMGFAFERTDYDDYPQFTDWIWAANALRALELTPVKEV